MPDLSPFFHSPSPLTFSPQQLGAHTQHFYEDFPQWEEHTLVLLGFPGQLSADGSHVASDAPDKIRAQLYALSPPNRKLPLVDLGNLKLHETAEANYESLAYVLETLIQAGKTVLILGGSQDLSYAQYLAYESLERSIEYVHVDARFDLELEQSESNLSSYNQKIFSHKPNYLFNFSNLGYQSYLVSEAEKQFLKSHNFLAMRYGELQNQMAEVEPYLRMAHMMSMDLSSIHAAAFPAGKQAYPGGFSVQEACQLTRYAGLSFELSSLSLCEYLPEYDLRDRSALLAAMMSWYFIEGFSNRRVEIPHQDLSGYRTYDVRLHASIEHIRFYQHLQSGRWWMEVPFQEQLNLKEGKKLLIPCSAKDYETAKGDDIPERWWLTYNKL